jgi:hypothetical protein
MNNPEECFQCRFLDTDSSNDSCKCIVNGKDLDYKKIYNDNLKYKDKDCPLIEINDKGYVWDGSGD